MHTDAQSRVVRATDTHARTASTASRVRARTRTDASQYLAPTVSRAHQTTTAARVRRARITASSAPVPRMQPATVARAYRVVASRASSFARRRARPEAPTTGSAPR
jgi:hypothetical protein